MVCKVFKMERDDVCNGISTSLGPHLYHIFTRTKISSLEQASLLLGIDSCLDVPRFQSSKLNWLVQVPPRPQKLSKVPSSRLSGYHEPRTNGRYDGDETNDVIDWMFDWEKEAEASSSKLGTPSKTEKGATRLDHDRRNNKSS